MKSLAGLQSQNERLAESVKKMEQTRGLASVEEKVCESCEDTGSLKESVATLQAANDALQKEMSEFKAKVAEQVEDTMRLEEEKILLIKENERLSKRATSRRAPATASTNKRRLELEKPSNNAD